MKENRCFAPFRNSCVSSEHGQATRTLTSASLVGILSSGQSRLGHSGSQSSHARSGGEAFTAWPNKSAERPRGPSQLSLFKDPSELSTQVIQHFGVRPALAAPYMDSCVILVMVSKQHPHSKPRATGSAATRKSPLVLKLGLSPRRAAPGAATKAGRV